MFTKQMLHFLFVFQLRFFEEEDCKISKKLQTNKQTSVARISPNALIKHFRNFKIKLLVSLVHQCTVHLSLYKVFWQNYS